MITFFTFLGFVFGFWIAWFFLTPFTEDDPNFILTDEDEKKEEVERIDFTKFKWFNKE